MNPAEPTPERVPRVSLQVLTASLRDALEAFDDSAANRALDALLDHFEIDQVIRDAVLPILYDIGERWSRAEVTVEQEHFASAVIAAKLRELARGWDEGDGARALVAAPPGELHEMGLMSFALLLRHRGWRISYLGASLPIDELEASAARLAPTVIVVAAVTPRPLLESADALVRLRQRWRLVLGGAGATRAVTQAVGADALPADPVIAADMVAIAASP